MRIIALEPLNPNLEEATNAANTMGRFDAVSAPLIRVRDL